MTLIVMEGGEGLSFWAVPREAAKNCWRDLKEAHGQIIGISDDTRAAEVVSEWLAGPWAKFKIEVERVNAHKYELVIVTGWA